MPNSPKTHFLPWLILLCCTAAGVAFWMLGEGYRAASPLVFILGVVGFYLGRKGELNIPFKDGSFSPRTGLNKLLANRRLEAQKRALWKNHIPELIAGLYLKHIRQYPDWKETAPEFMPPSITAVTGGGEGNPRMKIILNLNEYEFSFKEWSYKTPDNKPHTHGLLEIFTGAGTKLFGLILAKADVGVRERWEAADIEAFAEGPWISDFKKLAGEILDIIKEKDLASHEGG